MSDETREPGTPDPSEFRVVGEPGEIARTVELGLRVVQVSAEAPVPQTFVRMQVELVCGIVAFLIPGDAAQQLGKQMIEDGRRAEIAIAREMPKLRSVDGHPLHG